LGLPPTICTIYNGYLSGQEGAAARVALMAGNDVILRVAFESNLPVIDLRSSSMSRRTLPTRSNHRPTAGEKIARAIVRSFGLAAPPGDPSRVYY
jgi:hypothetical protein